MALFSGRILFNFGITERLRTLRYPIFTRGVVTGNGICSTNFFAIKSKNTGTSFGAPVSFEIKSLCLRMGGIVAQGAFADLFQRLLAEDVLCLAGVLGGGLLVHAQLHKEVGQQLMAAVNALGDL